MAKSVADVMKLVKENECKFVDFRFTDTRGKEQHVGVPISAFSMDKFEDGHAFDGSSIAGWKAINESDMCLMPDPVTATIDPFFAETTMVITCGRACISPITLVCSTRSNTAWVGGLRASPRSITPAA